MLHPPRPHHRWLLRLVLASWLVAGPTGCATGDTSCGDGECDTTDSTSSCGDDCPTACGDGSCTTPEESATDCPADCGPCAPLSDITELVATGELFFGYSMLGSAAVTPSCGELGNAKEIALSLTPAFDGELVLSTEHPSTKIGTVIELREGSCGGASLGCAETATDEIAGSRLSVSVEAGKPYVALVETGDDEAGVFALGLHRRGVCEGEGTTEDITARLLTGERFTADTSTSSSSQHGSCSAAEDNPEVHYAFTAPRDGVLVATTAHADTTFDTLLHVREGAVHGASYCDSAETEIACATSGAPADPGTLVRFDVEAARAYNLFVDGVGSGASGQGLATLTLGYATESPSQASLQGCDFDALRDQLAFFVQSGQAVYLMVDTVDAATAADMRLRVRLPDGTELYEADDDVECTFPPPSYSCPEYGFTADTAGLYTVEVYVGASESCTDHSLVDYQLTVTVDEEPSELILIEDR